MKVKIKRQDSPGAVPYWQTFDYDGSGVDTVAAILEHLNYKDDLFDENGEPCRRIKWDCSCMQKMCGACGMVVNREPVLACSTFINVEKTKVITIEPLTKFPVVMDLSIDRTCINEYMKNAEVFLGERREKTDPKEFQNQYAAAKCLKCGLCLEVCPNFVGPESDFYGAVVANESYLMHSTTDSRGRDIKKQYRKHFEKGCSKSLACRNVCPAKIPTLSSIGYMNKPGR